MLSLSWIIRIGLLLISAGGLAVALFGGKVGADYGPKEGSDLVVTVAEGATYGEAVAYQGSSREDPLTTEQAWRQILSSIRSDDSIWLQVSGAVRYEELARVRASLLEALPDGAKPRIYLQLLRE